MQEVAEQGVCSGVTMLELPSPPMFCASVQRPLCCRMCVHQSQPGLLGHSSGLGLGINARLFGVRAAPAAGPGLGAATPGVVLCIGSAVVAFPYFPNRLPARNPC